MPDSYKSGEVVRCTSTGELYKIVRLIANQRSYGVVYEAIRVGDDSVVLLTPNELRSLSDLEILVVKADQPPAGAAFIITKDGVWTCRRSSTPEPKHDCYRRRCVGNCGAFG